jgi:ketosteroid isomerase-like protein
MKGFQFSPRQGVLLILLCALAVPSTKGMLAAQEKGTTVQDYANVRKVLDDQVAAWNKADLNGFMAGYWESPELSFFSGKEKAKGWQATLDRYRKRYQAEGKEMGKLAFSDLEIFMLGPNHALVKGHFQLTLKNGNPSGLFTLILQKLPKGWRIIHDHTSS